MTSPTILHLSPGAFHRAHQAVYAEALIRAGHPEAGIRDVCLFPPLIGAAHAAQGGAYHVLLRDQTREDLLRITAIREVLDRPHPDMLCDPALRLVTMTLTEKATAMFRARTGSIRPRWHRIWPIRSIRARRSAGWPLRWCAAARPGCRGSRWQAATISR